MEFDTNTGWINELQSKVRGTVISRGNQLFDETILLFSNSAATSAQAVVLVLDAQDVSQVVLFARRNQKSISVKSGGYNTAGWSVQGDIVIDLCSIDQIEVHTPEADGKVAVTSLGTISTQLSDNSARGTKRSPIEAFGSLSRFTKDTRYNRDEQGVASAVADITSKGSSTNQSQSLYANPDTTIAYSPPAGPTSRYDANKSAMVRAGSASSSTTGVRSGGDISEETAPTSEAPSGTFLKDYRMDGTPSIKGKEKAVDPNAENDSSSSRSRSRDASEGTRSWVANQARDGEGITATSTLLSRDSSTSSNQGGLNLNPSVSNLPRRASGLPHSAPIYHIEENSPSYATSFLERSPSFSFSSSLIASSSGFPRSTFDPSTFNTANFDPQSFGSFIPSHSGITSAGFVFNNAALASTSSFSTSSGPTSAGFVFNTSALASTSTLSSAPLAQSASTSTSLPQMQPASTELSASTLSSSTVSTTSSPVTSTSALPVVTVLHALVTIGAGSKSKAIDQATSPFSYHVPLAAYPVGCAIFASGGFGFLSRLHGLSMDNVVEAEMVLPDGRIFYLREIDEERDDDSDEIKEMREMWWAFRGAGLTFGIITRVRVKAYHTGLVYSGNLIYPFNPATTPSLMKHWRECCKDAPRELYMNLILTAGPTLAQHVVVIQICYVGPRSEGDRFLQNIMSWKGEICLLKDVETRTYMTQQDSVVQVLSAKTGNRWCIRADLMNSLPDEAIDKTVAAFINIPERSAWLFETAAGAIADPSPSSSCFPTSHRSAPFQVAAVHQWEKESDDFVWTNAAVRWISSIISPHSPGSSYPCFLPKDSFTKVSRSFGEENWSRLVQLKKRVDPINLMQHTFWPEDYENDVKEPAVESQDAWMRCALSQAVAL